MSDNKKELDSVQSEPELIVEDANDNKKKKKAAKPIKEKKVTGRESFSRTRAIIGAVLIVAAIVVAILLVPVISGRNVTYQVLYAKTDVEAGIKMTAENIDQYFEARTTTDVNVANQGIPYKDRRSILEGVYTQRDIRNGYLVTVNDFSKVNKIYSDKVPSGKVLVAIDIPSLSGDVAYMPKAGDIIRIYRMVSRSESELYYAAANLHVRTGGNSYAEAYPYLQYVQVWKSVDGDLANSDETGKPEVAFVLAVNDGEQARQLVEAAYSGNYYFALISSGDKARAEAFLDYQDRIIVEGDEAGRTQQFFDLKDFTISGDLPKAGEIVRFSAAVDKGGRTGYEAPELLKYVDVVEVYDKNGKSVAFSETLDADLATTGSICLSITDEQAALLKELIEKGQVFMSVVDEPDDQVRYGFDQVNLNIWGERAKALNASLPSLAPEVVVDQKSE